MTFAYSPLLPKANPKKVEYRLISKDFVSTQSAFGKTFLKVEQEGIRLLTQTAMREIAHFLRASHLAQLRKILDDPEASSNDRFVALDLLKNANIAAAGVLPSCQDTGTAIVMGKKGQYVFTEIGRASCRERV
jgi:fumarate hydratase class I